MRIVLGGLGHGHLHVVAHARKLLDAGAEVVLIDDGVFRYSSLAAGILGGRYAVEDGMLDSRALAACCGVRHVPANIGGIDPSARRVRLEDGSELSYDIISLNLGSTVVAPFAVADGASVFHAKPLLQLTGLRDALRAMIGARQTPRLIVVGGGHSGCELAANAAALGRRYGAAMDITLIAPEDRVMADAPAPVSEGMAAILHGFGITVRTSLRCESVESETVRLADGASLPFDHVLLATGLKPSPVAHLPGLDFDAAGGLCVRATLQSVADDKVFAIGDCAHLAYDPRPNVGVFGVRAGPVLAHNLLAAIRGETMRIYEPQKHWFAALNLGDGTGFGLWRGHHWHGRLPLFLKERIDKRFMQRYRRLYSRRPVRKTPELVSPQ
ncbi:FAD-dependent oxidoreductase [Notoacmeibacter sp. MSK16QG-6]|uniref:FAD-dependent oxidoreductase n=1 Tax=Notoacmeibacter sp. MSK16QG-6 TaxID=2957982 RepID=UPI00209F83A9|nr:FAD-dependent oxidoreductase [Notoacmeibacter sp. MSK16QG-6]MCP1200400.1 FAD-dependent oxidoreductase [Notoacmeibacter sp. MSK16QG-6]